MYLPSEWHQQEFVQMTWPHEGTDWAPVFADAINCFCNMAREISVREPLVIVAQYPEKAKEELVSRGISTTNIRFIECMTNDTWARDHAFITCIDEANKRLILSDYQFNGWGLKFASDKDNQINKSIFPIIKDIYSDRNTSVEYKNCLDFVFEGGSIESDGKGTLMVTSSCLLSDNRNNTLTQKDIELKLKENFIADRVIWINHSWLDGDDTDGHIDTVARFCNENTIAYVKCYDKNDEHYDELTSMEQELKQLKTVDGDPYNLIPLPLPSPCYDDEGTRLPATYANFLIMNDAVLMPTYSQVDNDNKAIEQLQKAFPNHEIVGIECSVLVIQHGSLHCSTMQYPTLQQ